LELKLWLMEILVCPECKGELTLLATKEDGDEIVEGRLICQACNEEFHIHDGIPDLLPLALRS
jgi:uncharacterized protein YbaR (Trm112 family)